MSRVALVTHPPIFQVMSVILSENVVFRDRIQPAAIVISPDGRICAIHSPNFEAEDFPVDYKVRRFVSRQPCSLFDLVNLFSGTEWIQSLTTQPHQKHVKPIGVFIIRYSSCILKIQQRTGVMAPTFKHSKPDCWPI